MKLEDITNAFPKTKVITKELNMIASKLPFDETSYLAVHNKNPKKLEEMYKNYAFALTEFFEKLDIRVSCTHHPGKPAPCGGNPPRWQIESDKTRKDETPLIHIELYYWGEHNVSVKNYAGINGKKLFKLQDYSRIIEETVKIAVEGEETKNEY